MKSNPCALAILFCFLVGDRVRPDGPEDSDGEDAPCARASVTYAIPSSYRP